MPVSVQVIYPVSDGTTFDHKYYASTHMALVEKHWGPHIASTLVTKGVAGGPDAPPAYHAIASFTFKDRDAMGAAMKVSGPLLADIPNFTNVKPDMLIGDVTAS